VPTNTDNEPPTAIEVPSIPAPNATGITASGNTTAAPRQSVAHYLCLLVLALVLLEQLTGFLNKMFKQEGTDGY
jgi:hypothetical protein